MIIFDNLSFMIGTRVLFDGVSMNLSRPNRYGIVGHNGSGKSTLLELIAGIQEPSLGEINIPKKARVGFLKQDQAKYDHLPIKEVVLSGHSELYEVHQKKETLFKKGDWTEKEGEQYSKLEERYNALGGYEAESLIETLLEGVGIELSIQNNLLNTLSGGYKLRVLLAKVLFYNPDILLLDEPTNYLDIVTTTWLENYLKHTYQGLVLFVSHDRSFLNNLSTHILDIDYGEIRKYTGSFDKHLKQKEEIHAIKLKQEKEKEVYLKRMQRFIEKFRAKPSKSKQALSREKMLAKIEWPEVRESMRRLPHFNFHVSGSQSKKMLEGVHLSKAFSENILFCDLKVEILRGEKIAVVGPNGAGKTTLIKCLIGKEPLCDGSVKKSPSLKVGYFSQEHEEVIKSPLRMVEWLRKKLSGHTLSNEAYFKALGQVLFSTDDFSKPVSVLSGGERARLMLAAFMLQKTDLLVLDEPTNHLDLEAIDALVSSLKKYKGSVLFVSHNRFFIDQLASRKIEL